MVCGSRENTEHGLQVYLPEQNYREVENSFYPLHLGLGHESFIGYPDNEDFAFLDVAIKSGSVDAELPGSFLDTEKVGGREGEGNLHWLLQIQSHSYECSRGGKTCLGGA